MRTSLLLLCILAAFLTGEAKDSLKVRCISEQTRRPIAGVALTVEYPDTIVNYKADRKGKLRFEPSSYPLTITACADGMYDSSVGLMSAMTGTLTIELAPDPSSPLPATRRPADWSSERPRRLSSVYIVKDSVSKTR